jgi:5-methylcytosine-specific restriction endonuclease McrA
MSNKPPELLESKICEECGKEYKPASNRQKWCTFCGEKIKKEKKKEYMKKYHKEHYKKKGYNQKGENNNSYKTGIGIFRRKKLESVEEEICERCGSDENLLVHHKDRDRTNNDLDNLELLCKSCHQKEHLIRDPKTGRFIGSK